MAHLLYMKEQRFSTGTWGGAVLSGFTAKCGQCKSVFVVNRNVLTGGFHQAKSCRDLTCPYCGKKAKVKLDNDGRILEDNSYHGDD